jgi:hypothetical protein
MSAPHLPLRSCSHLLITMRRDRFIKVPHESTTAEISVIYYLHNSLLHYKDQNKYRVTSVHSLDERCLKYYSNFKHSVMAK